MTQNRVSFESAITEGWRLTKENIGLMLSYMGVLLLLSLVGGLAKKPLGETGLSLALVSLAVALSQWYVTFNGLRVSLAVVDGGAVSVKDFFIPRGGFGWYALASLLMGVSCLVGTILLIVPGVILWLMWMFYGYVIAEDGRVNAVQALAASARLTRGHKGRLFLFSLLLGGLNLLGLLCLGIGLFVTGIISFFALAHVYRQLTRFASDNAAAA